MAWRPAAKAERPDIKVRVWKIEADERPIVFTVPAAGADRTARLVAEERGPAEG